MEPLYTTQFLVKKDQLIIASLHGDVIIHHDRIVR